MQGGHTDCGHSNADTHRRCWRLATVARHAVGAAGTPSSTRSATSSKTQRQATSPRGGLKRLQSRIDLIIRDMTAVIRGCSSEAAAVFQPIDKTLDLRGPLAASHLTSRTPKIGQTRIRIAAGSLGTPGRASYRRGTVKSAKRCKEGRDPRRRHKPRRSNKRQACETHVSLRKNTRTQLHVFHPSHNQIRDAHKWCTRMLLQLNFIRGAAQGS